MPKCHIKKGQEVVVITGDDKGRRGRVIAVFPKKQRVLVEGIAVVKRHMRKSQRHPQGGIIERESPIHISNVMSVEKYEARLRKRGVTTEPTRA